MVRFYEILGRLERAIGGRRTPVSCDGRMGWPRRGAYFAPTVARARRRNVRADPCGGP